MQKFILKIYALLVSLLLFPAVFNLNAQENAIETVNHATLLGVGQAFLNDTYLSPLEYKGLAFSLMHERLSPAKISDKKLLLQQKTMLQVAFTKNPSASASEYYGAISYNANLLHAFLKNNRLKIYGGAGVDAMLGGIYNQRNSNNPGSLKTSLNLDVSAMATYNWKQLTFRWQLSSPFAGIFFSPAFGQSYYEIFSLGNGDGTILFGSFFNQLALQNYFTVDMPIKNITLRAGYLGNYYKTNVNDIFTKISSHQLMVGFALESINFGGKRVTENPLIKSSYY